MSQEELKSEIEIIQTLLNKLLNEECAEPRDFETDFGQLSDQSINFMDMIQGYFDYEKDYQFLQEIIEIFIQEFNKYISTSQNDQIECINFILDIIYQCLVLVSEQLNSNLAEQIIKMIASYFQQYSEVNEIGLDILCDVSVSLKENILPYLHQLWPYAIQGWNSQSILTKLSALKFIQDLSTSCKNSFSPSTEILEQLLDYFDNKENELQVRSQIIILFGDLFLNSNNLVLPYLDRTLSSLQDGLQEASEYALQPSEIDEIQLDVIEQYNQNLIESFQCINLSLEKNTKVFDVIETLSNFLKATCCEEKNPSQDFLITCLGLIADLIKFYKEEVKFLVNQEYTQYIVKCVQENDSSNYILKYFIDNTQKIK
ncbi:hypothetical protein TTHERM_00312280 (macronuclear) [Tetrahymena thermophila SB210]|uniref:Importin subunit beta-1/Transportin-1-like TPR repeats domain-containing protein n=1 Tax=Tetrahymena thermophila (strain SB210) TaxID=312017 RepID=Q22KQ3_TETTS|nr:hypothetical protein TTHERM_00312280 [Tetrahymena thermophila SB210]EAR85746.1 hypothetical protein TTHERM_00312280 [Tetrahymena thermophila SB210]|eukprot:XP_001033409.1 hypothetical protein TTHERM_00312280 [Tetrahymena thermophila SB210]